MSDQLVTLIGTMVCCFFGSGGVVIWFLNRWQKKGEEQDGVKRELKELEASISELKQSIKVMEKGLVICLENDKVIFKALRTHEINGESEEQERKMDSYFLSSVEESII